MNGIPWSVLQKFKLLLDRFSSFFFFAKRRKSVEKMTHRKTNRGHRTLKIVISTQRYSNGHFPYYFSLYYLARAIDAWRGMWISYAVRMRRNPQKSLHFFFHMLFYRKSPMQPKTSWWDRFILSVLNLFSCHSNHVRVTDAPRGCPD